MAETRIDLARARAHWFRRQGLAEPLGLPLPALVAITGWLRTLGGADVYLAARARAPGMRRADLDAAVEKSALRVVPAVRGCIYLVPEADVPLTLRVASGMWWPRTDRELERAGSSWEEVEEVAAAVLGVLRDGPRSPDGIRKALPDGAVRSLGERGKKIGLSSPLPVALRLLEFDDKIERRLETGRLDSERYVWGIAPAETVRVPDEPVARWARLLEIFLGFAGPATLAQFAAWSGLPQRAAKEAQSRIDAVAVAVEGLDDEALVLRSDLEALTAAPAGDAISLLSFEDNFLVLHGGPAVVTDPAQHGREVEVWGSSKATTLGEAAHLAHRTVVVGGVVQGFWEVDLDAGTGVWASFGDVDAATRARVDEQVAEAARFLLEDVGHARGFSLDTDEDIRRRAAHVKALGAAKKAAPKKRAVAAAPKTKKTKAPAKKPAAAPKTKSKKPAAKKAPAKKPAAKKPAAKKPRKKG